MNISAFGEQIRRWKYSVIIGYEWERNDEEKEGFARDYVSIVCKTAAEKIQYEKAYPVWGIYHVKQFGNTVMIYPSDFLKFYSFGPCGLKAQWNPQQRSIDTHVGNVNEWLDIKAKNVTYTPGMEYKNRLWLVNPNVSSKTLFKPRYINRIFNTGSNPAKGRHVLRRAIWELRKHRKMKGPHKRWIDRDERVFALLVSIPEDSRIGETKLHKTMLIAKGSEIFRGTVSTQIEVLWYAKEYNLPVLLAWKSPNYQRIRYFFCDAEWILNGNYVRNRRYGQTMANFPLSFGEEWTFDDMIQTILERLEEGKKNAEVIEQMRNKVWTLEDFVAGSNL